MAKAFPNTGAITGTNADRLALSGVFEGMQFFETDTNKMLVFDGSSWVEINNIGLKLITSSTFSAQSTVAIDNCFSSTYNSYYIIWYAYSSIANYASIRLRAGGTAQSTGSNYSYVSFRAISGNSSGVLEVSESQNEWRLTAVDDTQYYSPAVINLFGPYGPTYTMGLENTLIGKATTSEAQFRTLATTHQVANSYDGFEVFANTGNFTGTLAVYGFGV